MAEVRLWGQVLQRTSATPLLSGPTLHREQIQEEFTIREFQTYNVLSFY
jgi:hypothetical protein